MRKTEWYEDRDTQEGCLVLVVMENGTEVRGHMKWNGDIPLGDVTLSPLIFNAEDQKWHLRDDVKAVLLIFDQEAWLEGDGDE